MAITKRIWRGGGKNSQTWISQTLGPTTRRKKSWQECELIPAGWDRKGLFQPLKFIPSCCPKRRRTELDYLSFQLLSARVWIWMQVRNEPPYSLHYIMLPSWILNFIFISQHIYLIHFYMFINQTWTAKKS